MSALRVAINGACGRMGQRLVALGSADESLAIAAALESPGHARLGHDAGTVAGVGSIGVPVTAELNVPVGVVIDFSTPEGAMEVLATCVGKRLPLVLATTGFDDAQQDTIRSASRDVAILFAPSMSLAVNLTMKLARLAGEALRDHASGADVEILERHHRFKEDAPSGTALKFGEIIKQAMQLERETHGRHGRPGKRTHGEIGYHAIRTGDNPGEHTILFGLLGESIELTVKATSRDAYAYGALAAAKYLAGKPSGLYTMNDVLGL